MTVRWFDLLVRESGLPSLIAAPALRRALARGGVDADQAQVSEISSLVPLIESTLRVYLSDEKAEESLRRLRALSLANPEDLST